MARECPTGGDTRDCRKCGEGESIRKPGLFEKGYVLITTIVGHIARDCPQGGGGGGGGSRDCFKCGEREFVDSLRRCKSSAN